MSKRKIRNLLVAGICLLGILRAESETKDGTVSPAQTELKKESIAEKPSNPFDYGAPELNRHSAMAVKAAGRQLKLRGIISCGNGYAAMIDPGNGGKSMIVRKGGSVRIEIESGAKDASTKIAWLEFQVKDISDNEVSLCLSSNPQQIIVLR